jgi:hypothetical protein
MTQLNNKQIVTILQEELEKDGDLLREIVRIIIQEIMEVEEGEQVVVAPPISNYLKTIKGMK